jgi:hypothetical protein
MLGSIKSSPSASDKARGGDLGATGLGFAGNRARFLWRREALAVVLILSRLLRDQISSIRNVLTVDSLLKLESVNERV